MRVVFISGPFTGPTPWDTHKNVLTAEAYAAEIAAAGAMPFCPHLNSKNPVGVQDWGFWMAGCLEVLERCDAVFFLPGYRRSRGAMLEFGCATSLGKPMFFGLEAIAEWIGA